MVKVVEREDDLKKALRLIGKKYDLQIIDAIHSGKNRQHFNDILKRISEINPRILSMRLKDLERNKLITKSLVIGTPVKTEYSLTQKAEELIPIIESLKRWARDYK